jgi:C4-dicarboxylate transporter, DctQ subunit
MASRFAWLKARAEDVSAALIAAMFLAFMLQIVSRYLFNHPIEWTLEASLTTWLWAVFWGSAFCMRNNDHVRFDMLYYAVGHRTRRVFALISALAIVVAFAAALPRTWDFVSFLFIKKSATLRWPLGYVFMIYIVFMVATVLLYADRIRRLIQDKEEIDRVEHAGT